jgi:uncharacterized protein involved in outer membrane biogenesis
MGRIFKWIAGLIVLLVVLVTVSVYVILSRYDFNALKPHITKAVLEATGRELTIGGDIDLNIGFTPKLILTNIQFQNVSWGSRPAMVELNRFEVQVSLLPLIKGDIEIKRFILLEPDILIESDINGKSNLILKTPEKAIIDDKEKQSEPEDAITLPDLTFDILEIIKGKITYRDSKTGNTLNVNLYNRKYNW